MNTKEEQTCLQRVKYELASRMEDITKLWEMYKSDPEASDPDLGTYNEYGLSIDYVPVDGDYNDEAGYIRYQLSYGGPSDEFRFFIDADKHCYKIEYWFLNWGDGAKSYLNKTDEAIMREIFEDWKDCGSIDYWVDEGGK